MINSAKESLPVINSTRSGKQLLNIWWCRVEARKQFGFHP